MPGISNYYISVLKNKRAVALVFTFMLLAALTSVAVAFFAMTSDEIRSTGAGLNDIKAFYIAEAGRARARWALTTGGESVGWGEPDISFGNGTYTVTTVDNGDSTYTITSEGYIPDDTAPIAKRRVIERDIPVSTDSTNLSLAATASASSEQGGSTADNANDGDSGSKWKSSVNNGSWLKMDFASSTTFDRIVYDGSKIDSYTIEYSDDDSSWSGVSGAVEAPAGTVNFDSSSARYLRFSVNGNRPEVNEFESYDIAGGEDTTLGQGTFVTSW